MKNKTIEVHNLPITVIMNNQRDYICSEKTLDNVRTLQKDYASV